MSEGIRIEPGREEEFRHLQSWFAFSDRLDRMIEATEPSCGPEQTRAPAPVLSAAAQPAAVGADEPRQRAPRRRRPLAAPLVQGLGQVLRRIGEGPEAWGSAPPAREGGVSYQAGLHGGG
jgi:hypothetical protein